MKVASEAGIYESHGADKKLSTATACIYSAATYAPRYRTLEERIRFAISAVELEGLSLDLMLRGKVQDAKTYLELALQAEDPKRMIIIYPNDKKSRIVEEYTAIEMIKILLEHFDRLPEILKSALHDIDLLRARIGYSPLSGYIKEIVQ